jgi:hypothetical protein
MTAPTRLSASSGSHRSCDAILRSNSWASWCSRSSPTVIPLEGARLHPRKPHVKEWQSVSRCSVSSPASTSSSQYGHFSGTLKQNAVCSPKIRGSSLENSAQLVHVVGCVYTNACAVRATFLRISLLSSSTSDLLAVVRHNGHLIFSSKGRVRTAEGYPWRLMI